MPTEKKLTGYPSIDKPWLKYYTVEKKTDFDVNQTIYINFKNVAKQHKNDLAVVNYRTRQQVTFWELLHKVDECACGLAALGLNKSSKVVALTLNSFIDPIILLAANKIGAVIEFLDPNSDVVQMKRHASNANVLIIEGVFLPLAKLICDTIPVVVHNSSKYFDDKNYIKYLDFIKNGKDISESVSVDVNLPAVIIFSSGSTGVPKPIVHSNYSVNCAIQKMLLSDFPLNAENFLAKTIPSHIGLGVITSMLLGLMARMPQIVLGTIDESVFNFETSDSSLIAMFTVSESFDLIRTYKKWLSTNALECKKGLVFFAAPIFFKIILSQVKNITDMSFIKGVLLGGSKMSKEELDVMEGIFKTKGLSVPIGIGYGQNELCGAVALNTVHHNKNGSAGYPVWNTDIRIVDRDTYEDVKFNQIGLILEKSDSTFLYYDNMIEETAKTKIILSDGTEWFNSNDLGYMDEDGFIYITGRTTRVVIKTDHKISMDVIEEKIKGLECIRDVAVVPFGAEGDVIAFVVCNDMNMSEEALMELFKTEKCGLSIFESPAKLVIVNELPRMNNGKVDYQALEKEVEKL